MPKISTHQRAATENLQALAYVQQRVDDFPQWCVTIAFYVGVHVAEALFAVDNQHSDDLAERNHRLKTTKKYQHIWKHYRPLWNDSRIARYLTNDGIDYESFADYMDPETVLGTHMGHNLVQIIKSARRLLQDESFLKD